MHRPCQATHRTYLSLVVLDSTAYTRCMQPAPDCEVHRSRNPQLEKLVALKRTRGAWWKMKTAMIVWKDVDSVPCPLHLQFFALRNLDPSIATTKAFEQISKASKRPNISSGRNPNPNSTRGRNGRLATSTTSVGHFLAFRRSRSSIATASAS